MAGLKAGGAVGAGNALVTGGAGAIFIAKITVFSTALLFTKIINTVEAGVAIVFALALAEVGGCYTLIAS